MPDDVEVWEKICEGDAAAYNEFYREHAPRLQAFLRQITGNRQAAEDVAQETFTEVWKRPAGFRPERGTLRGYLYGIGRKRAADWWRRQPRVEQPRDDEAGEHRAPADSLIRDAFQRLPEEQRTLLWLREVEGQSYSELALYFDIPVGTVRSRLYAARVALRTIWHSKRTY